MNYAENPAEVIQRAAKLMRERAEAATPGPWWSDESGDCWRLHGVAFTTPPFLNTDSSVCLPGQVVNKQIAKAPKHGTPYAEYWPDAADNAWITSMHPAVGVAVAEWLEWTGERAAAEFYKDDPGCSDPDVCVCNGQHVEVWFCNRCSEQVGVDCTCWDRAIAVARAYLGVTS